MEHRTWLYLHILLFVFWLGGDVGVYLAMAFIKNPALSFETRPTIIRLAFYVDLFPRCAFALMLPVGARLAGDLGLLARGRCAAGRGLGARAGLACAAPVSPVPQGLAAGAPAAAGQHRFDALMGPLCVATGLAILAGAGPAWLPAPDAADGFGLKLLLTP